MGSDPLRLRFVIRGKAVASLTALGVAVFAATPKLASEDVILTTFYPAPSGVYTKLVATAQSNVAIRTGGVLLGDGKDGATIRNPDAKFEVRSEWVTTNGASARPKPHLRTDALTTLQGFATTKITHSAGVAVGCSLVTAPADGDTAACAAPGSNYRTLIPGVLTVFNTAIVKKGLKYYCCPCPSLESGYASAADCTAF